MASTQKKTDRYTLTQTYDIEASSLGLEITYSSIEITTPTPIIKDFKIINNKYCEISFYLVGMPSNFYAEFKLPYPISSTKSWNIVEFYVSHHDISNMSGTEDCLYTFKDGQNIIFTIASTKSSGSNAYLVHIKYLL